MKSALAALGFTATVAQVLLMRELVATFYGNELLFGLVLATWLAWVAVGSWGLPFLYPLRSLRLRSGQARGEGKGGQGVFAVGMVLMALLLPVEMALVRGTRALLGVTPGAFVELGPMAAAVVLILAPLCLLSGALFALGARLATERGGTAGRAYVWESAGAVVGGALFSFALVRWIDPFQIAFLVAAVDLAIASWLYRHPLPSAPPPLRSLAFPLLASCLLLLISFPLGRRLHAATIRWQWPAASTGSAYRLVFAGDSPYGRLTVQARDGQRVFYENGLLAFETQGTFSEEVAHFPLLMHPDPREVLLIGGGVAGDVREILRHPVSNVTYVELDPLLIEAARAHLPPQEAAFLDDPRVALALTDGRLYVQRAQGTFDVVILDLPEPSTGALNRFYTREFFEEVRAILDPGGVFALGLPSAENYWSPELARRNGSVYYTLRAVFPQVVVLPGERDFFLASDVLLETDPDALAGRLVERGVETRWVTPDYVKYVLTTDRFAGAQAELDEVAGVRLNHDLAPICYYYDLVLWLSRFYPGLRNTFEGGGLVSLSSGSWQALGWVTAPLAALVLLIAPVLLARWRRRLAVPFAVASIGLAEMALEVVILFGFQMRHGTLYAQVSLIVTAFMAGLASGAAVSNRLLAANRLSVRRTLIGVQAVVAIYSAVFPLVLSLTVPAVVFPILALLAGGLTGAAFPLAVALMRGQAGRAAGVLYGADLVGGCLGALLGAVFFVPLLGIPQTCVVVALVGLAGLLVVV